MHSTDPSTPRLFPQPHYIFKAWVGSFPPPASNQVYVGIWFMKSGFASPARSRSNSLQRGSGAQHIPCHAGRAAAFGIGRGEAPLQQPVQGNTALYSAQPFPPWFQAFRVSGIYKQLLLLPKLPPFGSPHPLSPLLRYSLAGTSRPRGCEIAALAPANKHQRRGEKKKKKLKRKT